MTRDEAISTLTGPGAPFELARIESGGAPMRVFRSAPANLRVVLEGTAAHDAREFLVYDDERLTFADFRQRVRATAHLLRASGVRKGDRVAIGMRNYPEWVIGFWAVEAIGAVTVPLNAWWTGPELSYGLADSGSIAAIVDGERLERIEPQRASTRLEHLWSVRCDPSEAARRGVVDLVEALDPYATAPELPPADIDPDDDATILYTSGTTGFPKGAISTHRNHVTNLMTTAFGGALAALVSGAAPVAAGAPAAGAPAPQLVSLQTFPFFHIGGLSGLYITTAFGGKLVLMYRWDVAKALELVEREGISTVAGVPTVVRQLLEAAAQQGRKLSSLGGIASGGAPVPPDLVERIDAQFAHRVSPGNGYGLTETTSAVITNGGEDYFRHPDSVGRPVVVADARIVADDGRDCDVGEVGEIWIRGPHVIRGYWNKPADTAEALTDGWFHTGDLGYRDKDGFFYVVDRKKDVVIRGGENVYCAEVEAALFEHPAVADVAVIGLPHRELGEEVAAVIQTRPGIAFEPHDVEAFLSKRLARFKVPSRFFPIDEPLPRTATGKVLKRQLRDRFGGG